MKKLLLLMMFPLSYFGQNDIDSSELYETTLKVQNYMLSAEQKYNEKDFYGAIEILTKGIEMMPDTLKSLLGGMFYSVRAASKIELGDNYGAISDYTNGLNLLQELVKNLSIDSNFISVTFYQRAMTKKNIGDISGSVFDLTNAIKFNPKYEEAYYARALGKSVNENYWEAIIDLNKVIDLNPNNAKAYTLRGMTKKIYLNQNPNPECSDYKKGCDLGDSKACEYYNEGCY